jgi:hypothetical protein
VFADPIGLKVYIDGFNFGDVAADTYKFSEGGGNVNPGVEFSKSFGAFKLTTSVQDTISFKATKDQDIRWAVKGAYALQLAEASKLTFSAYNKLHILGDKSTFADTKADQITDMIGPGVRFDQTLGFGTLYAIAEVDIKIHTKDGQELELGSGDDDGFKVGATTNFGLYGYLQPKLSFRDTTGKAPASGVLQEFRVRVGYVYGSIDGRVTVYISTVEKGFEANGLRIQPRVTYNNIIPGLAAYADFDILKIGAKSPAKLGFKPQIGVSYAF